jgi:cytohesin
VLGILLIWHFSACLGAETPDANESTKYLDAVREFADNVLKYGRDTYGPKQTPLFVDGLNIHTHEPVKWISPKGDYSTATDTEEWILSNFASQQTLLRTLDGLTGITGDPKYRQAAMDAIRYAFENLRSPNGLLYWGHEAAYDAQADKLYAVKYDLHVLKLHYPYYELMWQVDPDATKTLIEAFWSAHMLDWSNLDMNRIGSLVKPLEEPWKHKYEGGPTFFESKEDGHAFFTTGTSLVQAGTVLSRLSGQEEPLVWSKRLIQRYVDTRHPKAGIAAYEYNRSDPKLRVFPLHPYETSDYPEDRQAHPWLSVLLVGEMLGDKGETFTRWALEELTGWGRASYRKEDNFFMPMLTDGTNLEGHIWKELPSGLNVARPSRAVLSYFWAYCVAYSVTGDALMWEMVRNIALGNGFGDIGQTLAGTAELETQTDCSDVYGLLGFLRLYEKTMKPAFLEVARRIGDNILARQFHKGFFVPSKRHIYTRFDCFEPLVLLHLAAAIKPPSESVPRVWPSMPVFAAPYRYRQEGRDRLIIYTLTESTVPPLSLHDAAAIGDVNFVASLLEKGTAVDSVGDSFGKTALQYAALRGHRDVAELLLAKGARIDAQEDWPGGTALDYAAEKGHKEVIELLVSRGADINAGRRGGYGGDTPLHSAVRTGHKDVVELLIAKGANINAKNNKGQTPLDIALIRNQKDIVELLQTKGAGVSTIHAAVRLGDADKTRSFLEKGIDVNVRDENGATPLHLATNKDVVELLIAKGADVNAKDKNDCTPLHSAVKEGRQDVAELLVVKGADINAKDKSEYTPLYYAVLGKQKEIIKLLVAKGADVNFMPKGGYPLLCFAVWFQDKEMVELLVAHGAKFDFKDQDGCTAFRYAVAQGNRELVEFFVSKGVDVSTLHMAACMGDSARVRSLLEQGTNVDTKDELGWTPLYWAASTGQAEVGELLITKGADIQAKTNDEETPLHQASFSGSEELVKLLISKNADVNAKDKNGTTPLHNGVSSGSRAIVELLLAKGASINAQNRNNRTPLHFAAIRGQKEIVEVLIAKGADINAKDTRGLTPLRLAENQKRAEIVELLRQHGAKE